jgi:hypothetical protein
MEQIEEKTICFFTKSISTSEVFSVFASVSLSKSCLGNVFMDAGSAAPVYEEGLPSILALLA